MPHRFCISQEGYKKLQEELHLLNEIKMPEIAKAISRARANGDLRENGEYQGAKELQRITGIRVEYLTNLFKNAKIINVDALDKNSIYFGASVHIRDENDNIKKFKIVGEYESNPSKDLISISSPIAQACIGKKISDIFSVKTPNGEKEYEIFKIEY